jgi:Zn-dependent alcohol dehydrogenase
MTFVRAISAELGPTARPRRPGMASRFTRDFFSQSSFATHAVATERNVTKVDPSLPLKIVAPFGCGIQTRQEPCSMRCDQKPARSLGPAVSGSRP